MLAYGLFAANVLLLCGVLRAGLEDPAETGFSLLLLSTPLIVQTSWPHYFVYLPFCQVFAWQVLGRRRTDARAVLQHGLLGVSAVLSSSVFFNWFGDFSGYSWYGCLFWSNMLVAAVLYVELVPMVIQSLRGERRRAATPDNVTMCNGSTGMAMVANSLAEPCHPEPTHEIPVETV